MASETNTLSWFRYILGLNFIIILFSGQVRYDNKFKTMEIYLNQG